MPRPLRSLRGPRRMVRRRHRTWMVSMTLASLGWGCWWLDLLLARTVPDVVPHFALVATLASLFAVAGLAAGLFALRGRNRAWFVIALWPVLANLALLAVPLLLPEGFPHD